MARASMAALISRVRLLINDTAGTPQFTDDQIQDVLDASRQDLRNVALAPAPTYTGSLIQYLDYYSDLGDWEDDLLLKQFLVNAVTPTTSENIVGHWVFSATTLPPVYITGKTYDIYKASADLLERWAAAWAQNYNVSVDGQSFQRGMVLQSYLNLAASYRKKQRPVTISANRTDLLHKGQRDFTYLGPQEIDYMGSGNTGGH